MSQTVEYQYRPENLNESAPNRYDESKLTRQEMVINIGPQHPSTHGVLRLEVVTDGEIVVDVVSSPGLLTQML